MCPWKLRQNEECLFYGWFPKLFLHPLPTEHPGIQSEQECPPVIWGETCQGLMVPQGKQNLRPEGRPKMLLLQTWSGTQIINLLGRARPLLGSSGPNFWSLPLNPAHVPPQANGGLQHTVNGNTAPQHLTRCNAARRMQRFTQIVSFPASSQLFSASDNKIHDSDNGREQQEGRANGS